MAVGDRSAPKRLGDPAPSAATGGELPTVPSAAGADQVLPESLRSNAQADGIERLVVGAVIHDHARALLVTRSAGDDFLPGIEELPSGGVEPGETLSQALTRELREEIGFRPDDFDAGFLATFDYTSGSGRRTRQLTVSAPLANRAVELSEEHVSARWVAQRELPDSSATSETKQVLEAWFAWNQTRP